jgi:hypothetical protein
VKIFFLLDNLRKQSTRRVPLTPVSLFSKLSAQCAGKVFSWRGFYLTNFYTKNKDGQEPAD